MSDLTLASTWESYKEVLPAVLIICLLFAILHRVIEGSSRTMLATLRRNMLLYLFTKIGTILILTVASAALISIGFWLVYLFLVIMHTSVLLGAVLLLGLGVCIVTVRDYQKSKEKEL